MRFNNRLAACGAAFWLALASVGVITVATPTPAVAATQDVGERSTKIDSSDKITRKEVVAATAPVDGQPSITVHVKTHYLYSPWAPWKSNQTYFIKSTHTAEYVSRLGYWMLKDAEGVFHKFTPGSVAGTQVSKPVVDIGSQPSKIDGNDRSLGSPTATAGAVSLDGRNRSIELTYRYTHSETYNDVTYSVTSPVNAQLVDRQDAFFVWVGSTLYKVDRAGNVRALSERPVAQLGVRDRLIDRNDREVSWNPTISAGQVSGSGSSRTIISTRTYENVETFQRLQYELETVHTAQYVREQRAYMAWIDGKLYKVAMGSDIVYHLQAKQVVDEGSQLGKLNFNDQAVSIDVLAKELTSDNKSVVVTVRRNYRQVGNFQDKEYHVDSRQIANYNQTYKVWTVVVDGRIYAITFPGDPIVTSSDVIVIKAPGSLRRPDITVVNPGNSSPGDPPVVVPGKRTGPTNSDDDVVVPGKHRPAPKADDDVVVPGKHRPAPKAPPVDDDDVVVPSRRR